MRRSQRLVKIGFWVFLPVLLLGSVGAIAGALLFGFEQNRDIERLPSPDGHFAATLNISNERCGLASSGKSQIVFVERRLAGMKNGLVSPFCVGDPNAKVTMSWRDNRTLLIACEGCEEGKYEETDANWGNLRFVFDTHR